MDRINGLLESKYQYILDENKQTVRNFVLDLCLVILEDLKRVSFNTQFSNSIFGDSSLEKESKKYDGFLLLIKVNENGLYRDIIDYIFYKRFNEGNAPKYKYYGKLKKNISRGELVYICIFRLTEFCEIEICKLLYHDWYIQKSYKIRLFPDQRSNDVLFHWKYNGVKSESLRLCNYKNTMKIYKKIEENLSKLKFDEFVSPLTMKLSDHFKLCKNQLYMLLLCIKKAKILTNNIIPILILEHISVFLFHKQLIINKELEEYISITKKINQASEIKKKFKRELNEKFGIVKRQKLRQ